MIKKIISGGQTGVDELSLSVAKSLNIPTGGTAPKGYRTEAGPNMKLLTEYGLIESTSYSYDVRTRQNIKDSDGTVVFGDIKSPGTKLTLDICHFAKKPYICNPTIEQLIHWIIEHNIETLNVAGNRASKLGSEEIEHFRYVLYNALYRRS